MCIRVSYIQNESVMGEFNKYENISFNFTSPERRQLQRWSQKIKLTKINSTNTEIVAWNAHHK